MKLAVGTWAFGVSAKEPAPLEETLTRIAEAGYDGIQYGAFPPHPVPLSAPGEPSPDELKARIASYGLELSGLVAAFDASPISSPEPPADYLAQFDANLRLARELGIGVLRVDTVDPPEAAYEVDDALQRLVATWGECARRAQGTGVEIAWEFEPCFAFNESEQIIAIAEALDGLPFGIQYDTAHAHMVAEVGARQVSPGTLPGGQLELLERLGERIIDVHILDSDGSLNDGPFSSNRTTRHMPIGSGDVDFAAVVPALAAARRPGEWWCVDLCFAYDTWGNLASSRELAAGLIQGEPIAG